MESIESLPRYNALAAGAVPPKGWQMTIRWYSHLMKEALLMDLGGQVFHLVRVQRQEMHFNVIGELREPAPGSLENIVTDDGTATGGRPSNTEWLALPVFAEIVVHLETKTFHVRYSDEWNTLSSDQKDNTDKRNSTLHGVPSPVVSFCLGADALLVMHKLLTVLRAVAKQSDLPFESRSQAIGILREKLSNAGIDSSLVGSAEWDIPDNDWNSPGNTCGFAFARIAHPDAHSIFLKRRVVVHGVEGPNEKMYYLAVTQLGALADEAVTFYNEGTRIAIAQKKVATDRAEYYSRDLLPKNWQLFSTPPPGSIVFPADPELCKRYILGLTRFARQRSADPTLRGQLHNKGCVCQWITKDASQLVCGWCSQDKYNGRKQFCDHINGQKHQKKCEADAAAFSREALSMAVSAVHEATLLHGEERQAGEEAPISMDRWHGEEHGSHPSSASGAHDTSSQWGRSRWAGDDPSGAASASSDAGPWRDWHWRGEDLSSAASATHDGRSQWSDKRCGWGDGSWDSKQRYPYGRWWE